MIKEDEESEDASNEDEKESAWAETFRHADEHAQSSL